MSRGYRFEPLVLVLVALAALPVVGLTGPQDRTRYDLTRSLVFHQSLEVHPSLFDRAEFEGRSYSDKAPGMSFLAVPAFQLERALGIAKSQREWESEGDVSLWLMRVLTSGVLFLAAVFVVGRLAERLSPGAGALTAAAFGVATIAGPLAPTFFEHDAAAALAIAGFAFAWRGRPLWPASLCAGTAVLFQYAAGLVALALLAYCAFRYRRRALGFVLGAVPPALALGAYNWAAFDSPFHLSYRYVANPFAERQRGGFFGIGLPTLDGLREVLVGNRGLLVFSPMLALAALGLWLLWRRGLRAEALLAGGVSLLFVLLDAGYFLPYGGGSPGPRFLAPALPFLVLGLPAALERFRRTTIALVAVSAAAMSVNAVTWGVRPYDDPAWVPGRDEIARTAWTWLGVDRNLGALLVLLCSVAAVGVGTVQRR